MPKISERAQAARARRQEESKPDFTVRARVGRIWMRVGSAWNRQNGEGLSIKLSTVPVGFDGVLKVLVPLPDEEDGQEISE